MVRCERGAPGGVLVLSVVHCGAAEGSVVCQVPQRFVVCVCTCVSGVRRLARWMTMRRCVEPLWGL